MGIITMLPGYSASSESAKIFDVSIDELLGYKSTERLGEICLKIKEHFSALPEKKAFENVYRIAALLHEIASTDGYKKTVPWKEKDYATDHISSWGLSICSEPEGCTGRKNNNIFFSLGEGYVAPNGSQMRDLKVSMEQFSNLKVLKTLFSLHGLTAYDFDHFVTADQIASAASLNEEEVETALRELPLTVKEEEGTYKYRLDGACSHIPILLSFLY